MILQNLASTMLSDTLVNNAAEKMASTMSGWSVNNFLANLNKNLSQWGGMLIVVVGLVMVIVAVIKIAKGLMSGGRNGQTNWVLNIVLFFLGGALAFGGGWSLVQGISQGGSDTLNDLGKMVIPYLSMWFS